jgi:DNA invertase Pin-like site-specific DNA recombinase
MHAGVYLRQSRDTNGTGLAVARQREDCLKLCRERGWEHTEYVDNDISAYSGKRRPAYEQMLTDIEAGNLDAVVAWDLDRLHRRPVELEQFMELADRHRIALATFSGDTDLSTDNGRLFARIKGAVARAEGERKSARQKRAALQKAELGQPSGGPRAFGYERDGVTVRETEAEALRQAYASLLAGRSLVGLGRDLNAAGFLTARLGKPFNHSSVRAVLVNARNAGLRSYRGEIVGPAAWPAIVDEDSWRAAHALLTDSSRRTNRTTARIWLLGGLALCGVCDDGTQMKVTYRGERTRDGTLVRSYKCRKFTHLTREASWVDWRVSERVIARLSRDDARDLLIDEQLPDLGELRRESDTLRLRLEQLAENFADGTLTAAQLKAGTERLRSRLAEIDAKMVHIDRAPLLADLVAAKDVRAVWENLRLDRQRAIIDALYTVIVMKRPVGRGAPSLDSVRMEAKT